MTLFGSNSCNACGCLQVFKGVYDLSTEVAIKTIKCETREDMVEAIREVSMLKNQLHPNIVQFLGVSISVSLSLP